MGAKISRGKEGRFLAKGGKKPSTEAFQLVGTGLTGDCGSDAESFFCDPCG